MPEVNGRDIRTVVIACDAGMGSSVMVASQMRNRLKKYDVSVEHLPVNSIPADAQVIVCHAGLAQRVRERVLKDLARRRKSGRQQLEQLRAAR